ncbi:TonB-dependent receptor [Paucibacter sp. TC2R-5]|uniref:TonB-dependent receptor plug domain-containing protein n=1 Tax=Paucibacter sp. TC2R-5 TaxID=2893555 RepID=UPI0021E4E302|nr:TonB-dependent receptor [Paucibacter sp. TC2R-5]MCV2359610.1 TonB-dependent receptor [Paucibacter sp. TC2R-5]
MSSLVQSAAWAQSSPGAGPNKLGSVVVTATRSPQALGQVLSDVTVLTRADIERQAIGSLADLLRSQPGFEMVRNGGAGANTSMFVRGADTRHTVVIIDGQRIDSQASSGASWAAIPLAQIDRVEIVRGAASAIWGSDAIGGVVQIFTRRGDSRPQVDLGLGAGNLGLVKLDAAISGLSGIVDYAVSVAAEQSNGFNARPVLNDPKFTPDDDGYRNRNASLRLGAQLNAAHRLELTGLNSHVDAQYDATAKPKTDDQTLSDTRALRAGWTAQWNPELNSNFSVGESMERYETRPSPYLTETKLRSYSLNGSYKIGDGQINALLERREDRLNNSGLSASPTPGRAERHQDAIGAGYIWGSGPLSLQLHGRHDKDSEFGGSDTGTAAIGYQVTPQWRVLSSLGTAFRAPTLYQRFSDYGNPKLIAEEGKNAEIGIKFSEGVHGLGLTVYRNLVDNLIIFGAPGLCRSEYGCYQNVNQARLQGLTLTGASAIGSLRLSGSLDMQSPKDVTDTPGYANYGKLLTRRSKQHGSLRADTDLGLWTLGAQVVASGMRYDDAANTKRLGGYALLGLDAQYKLGRDLQLQLKLDNALDKAYQTAGGYASAPRQFFIGLRHGVSL